MDYVQFPAGSFMDRSNATIWSADARASDYYDSNPGKTTIFHYSELTQKNIQGWLNAGYEARYFQGSLENEYDYNAGGAPLYDATPDLITSTVDVSEVGPILIYDTARGIAQLVQLGNYFKGLRGI